MMKILRNIPSRYKGNRNSFVAATLICSFVQHYQSEPVIARSKVHMVANENRREIAYLSVAKRKRRVNRKFNLQINIGQLRLVAKART